MPLASPPLFVTWYLLLRTTSPLYAALSCGRGASVASGHAASAGNTALSSGSGEEKGLSAQDGLVVAAWCGEGSLRDNMTDVESGVPACGVF